MANSELEPQPKPVRWISKRKAYRAVYTEREDASPTNHGESWTASFHDGENARPSFFRPVGRRVSGLGQAVPRYTLPGHVGED
jgi:hypothetical protein